MDIHAFDIRDWPVLRKPVFVIGFGGWGNALNVARATAAYLAHQPGSHCFGTLKRDLFFRFDQDRPTVTIENGLMHSIKFAEGGLFASSQPAIDRDLVVLVTEEPHLAWEKFADQVINIATIIEASELISLGSMYDGVLHTDTLVSGIASSASHLKELEAFNIRPITYHGPTAIHAILHRKACERSLKASSLWTHCPYYLEGTSHPGLIAATVDTVARMLDLTVDTQDLAGEWERLKTDIQVAIEENPKLQKLIGELRRAKVRGAWAKRPDPGPKADKIIRLKDFRDLN
jgi:predicted ATP-grasp superfamily ATP-dependent carboligase